jgi:hypothetical protein
MKGVSVVLSISLNLSVAEQQQYEEDGAVETSGVFQGYKAL